MLKKLITAGIALAASATMAFSANLKDMSWDEIVAQAKKEGELTWYVWYLRDDLRAAAKTFEAKYGIKVTIPEGTSGGNNDKLLAEKSRDVGDIDVFAMNFAFAEDWDMPGLFQKIDTIIPKPEKRTQELVGVKGGGYLFAFWGNQTGIAYDPDKVAEADLPQTPADFASFWSANPGKFGFNYVKGGSGPSFFQNIIRNLSDVEFYGDGKKDLDARLAGIKPGIDFFNKHAEDYVITASNADSITRVSDKELWMVAGWEDHVAGLQKRGEIRKEIKFYVPSMGMRGGGNGVAIPNNAPHPAAAILFIDWVTSSDAQTMFNTDFGTVTMNADANSSNSLIPADQRKYREPKPQNPFYRAVNDMFTEEVVLNR